MDYLFKPPTQMQENSMTGMQQTPLQTPLAMEMRPLENARGAVPEPPELVVADPIMEANYQTARRHLEYMRRGLSAAPDPNEEYHWLRNITGGGRATFSSKRNADGSLRTDMSPEEYDTLERLTGAFYDMTENLAEIAPREQALTLYRGIRIPKVKEGASKEEIEEIMSRYGDVIPSSASWGMETPQHFSNAEEGQDAVVLHMIVPPDFPLVMLSCPEKVRGRDPQSLDLQGQQEVLVGASTFSDVQLLETEEGHHCYHVEVKLNAVPRGAVFDTIDAARQERDRKVPPNPPVIRDHLSYTKSVVQNIFGMSVEEMKKGDVYERSDQPGIKYRLTETGSLMFKFDRIKEEK